LQLSILDIVRVTNKDALKRIAHLESSLAGLIKFCTFRRASHPVSSGHNVCDFNAAAETALSRLSVLAQRLLAHTHALLEIKHFTQHFIDISHKLFDAEGRIYKSSALRRDEASERSFVRLICKDG
jgi:hypothetical protein